MDMWKCLKENRQLPIPDEDTLVFWEGCRRRRLLIQQCHDCYAFRFPPSPLCPQCWSSMTTWRKDPGRGEVLTFCVYHSELAGPAWRSKLPYVVAVVELLQSRVKMLGNLIVPDPEVASVGLKTSLGFETIDNGVTLPQFYPLSDCE
jgi:uncharacterized OB-fold protein